MPVFTPKMPKNRCFCTHKSYFCTHNFGQILFPKVGKWPKKWAKLYTQTQKPLKKVTKIHPKTHKKWAWSNLGQQKWAEKWVKMGRNIVRNKPHYT